MATPPFWHEFWSRQPITFLGSGHFLACAESIQAEVLLRGITFLPDGRRRTFEMIFKGALCSLLRYH
jgi:hypothetical protein